jgi:transcriptional regulator with XRE-family HTH domain
MKTHHVQRKAQRTPAQTAKLRLDRERYQREPPTPEQLLAEGGHAGFVPLGELLEFHQLMTVLRRAREQQGLTLSALAKRIKMDSAALSRLETGQQPNPTLDTLFRVAAGLGKAIYCICEDAPVSGQWLAANGPGAPIKARKRKPASARKTDRGPRACDRHLE